MIQTVVDGLKKQYNVLSVIDLEKFFTNNGQKWLFDALTSVHCDAYQPQDRIVVIYTKDQFDYDDLPGQALVVLQKILSTIDISNSFVTVVTTNSFIQHELEQSRSLYSTDQFAMNYVLVDGDFVKKITVQDTMCKLAWNHLYIGPDGSVLPCCVADQNHPLGNINSTSIKEIVAGPKYQQLRQNMLSGRRSKECHSCYRQEDQGFSSIRHASNDRWKHSNLDSYKPVFLDIRLNNTCNLKCRMCSGYYSSAIAQEEKEIFDHNKQARSVVIKSKKQEILKELDEYLPDLEQVYFAGGEPLLVPEHYAILNRLIELNNVELELCYNTNFTVIKYKNQTVFDYWNKFKNIRIGASLDACGKVAEYIRHGCTWSDIEYNLQQLKQHSPHVTFTVTSTVGFMNVESLIDLQQSWNESKILSLSKFSLTVMMNPVHLTVAVLPSEHKRRLNEIILKHIHYCQSHGAKRLASQWQNVLHYMMQNDHSYALPEFRRLTNIMDQHRGESFAKVFPEYQDLL